MRHFDVARLVVVIGNNRICVTLQQYITNLLKTDVCPRFGSSEQQVSYS